MPIARKLEIASGVTVLVLGLVVPFCRFGIPNTLKLYSDSPSLLLDPLVLF